MYSKVCYMKSTRSQILRRVLDESKTSQSELSRLSGVRQPSISQFLSGKVELSDEQLERLISCVGYELEVVRRPVERELNRSEQRTWKLHRSLGSRMTRSTFSEWKPVINKNIVRLRSQVKGQPHLRNLDRWEQIVEDDDVKELRLVLCRVDRDSIEMREVSPMSGLMTGDERRNVLGIKR